MRVWHMVSSVSLVKGSLAGGQKKEVEKYSAFDVLCSKEFGCFLLQNGRNVVVVYFSGRETGYGENGGKEASVS